MNKRELYATWDLQRFWFTDDNGVEVDPLGTDPAGNLILGTDGRYAFNMMRRDRSSLRKRRSTRWDRRGERRGRGRLCIVWRHLVFRRRSDPVRYRLQFVSTNGGQQKRLASFDGDELLLQTTGSILLAGKLTAVRRSGGGNRAPLR